MIRECHKFYKKSILEIMIKNITKSSKTKELSKMGNFQKIKQALGAVEIYYSANTLIENLSKSSDNNDFSQKYYEVSLALGLATHLPVVEIVSEKYKTFLMEMIKDVEREFLCKTASEKILAEIIATAHIRALEASQKMMKIRESIDNLFELDKKVGLLSVLSKEVDRANRQLFSAIQMLEQKKRPPMKLNIRAKTAFIAKNQQINNLKVQKINECQ